MTSTEIKEWNRVHKFTKKTHPTLTVKERRDEKKKARVDEFGVKFVKPIKNIFDKSVTTLFSKSNNKMLEKKQVDHIVSSINLILNNSDSFLGLQLCKAFKEQFGQEIIKICNNNCGGRNTHHDLEIVNNNDNTLQGEVKGTNNNNANLSKDKPWINSVQEYNMSLNNLDMSTRYAKLYFSFLKELGAEYGIDCTGFTFDDYFKDFKRQNSIQCKHLIKIKKEFIKRYCKQNKKVSPQKQYKYRVNEINKQFVAEITEIEKQQFIESAQRKITESFEAKDCWLQIAGLTPSEEVYAETGAYDYSESEKTCKFMWSPKINPPVIKDIQLSAGASKGSAQLYVTYIIEGSDKPSRTSIRLRNSKFGNWTTDFK